MAASDAKPIPIKSAAFRYYFPLRLTTGALVSTATGLDTELSLDGAAYADATNEWTEIGTSGSGYIDLTAAEMAADAVTVKTAFTNTSNMTFCETIYPQEAGDIPVNVTYWRGTAVATPATAGVPSIDVLSISGDTVAADNLEAYCDGTTPQPVSQTHLAGVSLLTGTAQSYTSGTLRLQSGQSAYVGDVLWTTGGSTAARSSGEIATITGAGTASPDVTFTGGSLNGPAPAAGTTYVIIPRNGLASADASLLATAASLSLVATDVASKPTLLQILSSALTESYAADGAAPTLTQAVFAIQQFLQEKSISGTTLTVKKLDGSTTAMTFSTNDSANPTAITRST